MTTKSMDGIKEYLLDCLFYLIISMIWYRNLLFRCLPEMSYTGSKVILWIMILLSVLISTLVLNRYKWTSWSIAKALIVPFGVYTILTYKRTVGWWMTVVLICASALAVTLFVFVMTRKIKDGKKISVIIKRRIHHCCIPLTRSVAVAFSSGFTIRLFSL